LMTATFPTFKLHSSNSHLSNCSPKLALPLEGGGWNGKCSSNHRAWRPCFQRELGADISSSSPLEGNIGTPDQG
jgi:hypothetical protein